MQGQFLRTEAIFPMTARLVALSLCTLFLVYSVSSQPVDTASGQAPQQVPYLTGVACRHALLNIDWLCPPHLDNPTCTLFRTPLTIEQDDDDSIIKLCQGTTPPKVVIDSVLPYPPEGQGVQQVVVLRNLGGQVGRDAMTTN